MKKHVVVQPYEKTWADDFVAIRDELDTVLHGLVLRIEHVGSTSVEGLSAKPIIDIDVVIRDRADLPEVISALQKIGYLHEGDQGIPDYNININDRFSREPFHRCASDMFYTQHKIF